MKPSSLLSLTALYAIAMKCTLLMPIIVVELVRAFGLPEEHATELASLEVVGLMGGLVLSRGVARWMPAAESALGLVLCLVGEWLTLHAHGATEVGTGRCVAGLGAGLLVARIANALAGKPQAERWWGQITLFGGAVMGVLMVALSWAQSSQAPGWIFRGLMGFIAALAPLLLLLPAAKPHAASLPAQAAREIGGSPRWWAAILAATFGIYAAMSAQWAVAGLVGARWALPNDAVGFYLAISVLGFAGAAVPGFLVGRLSERGILVIGALVWGASLLWFFNVRGAWHFAAAQTVMSAAFYVCTPYIFGRVGIHDPDGRRVTGLVLLLLVALSAATAISGPLYAAWGTAWFSVAMAACGTGALLLLALGTGIKVEAGQGG